MGRGNLLEGEAPVRIARQPTTSVYFYRVRAEIFFFSFFRRAELGKLWKVREGGGGGLDDVTCETATEAVVAGDQVLEQHRSGSAYSLLLASVSDDTSPLTDVVSRIGRSISSPRPSLPLS